MNPLDWSGPEFLGLFLPLLILSFLVASLLKWWMSLPGSTTDTGLPRISPYEAALLRGREALVEAALASLVHQGRVRMDVDRLVITGPVPFTAPLIERIVHAAVEAQELRRSELVRKAKPAIQQLRASLVRRGWLVDDTWAPRAQWLSRLPILAMLLPGFLKILVGLERGRPVAFLVIVCLVGLIAFFVGAREPWRSRRGDAVLRALRDEQEPLKQTARTATSPSEMSSQDMAMAVGLFGMSAVGYTEFELMRRHLQSSGYGSSSGSSGDSGGGCGGGDSGGGGDGGGGDGGGGGCGGCGGGGCS